MMMTDESTPLSLPPPSSSVSSCHFPLFLLSPLPLLRFHTLAPTHTLDPPPHFFTPTLSSCCLSPLLFISEPFCFKVSLSLFVLLSHAVFSPFEQYVTISLYLFFLTAVPEPVLLFPSISVRDGSKREHRAQHQEELPRYASVHDQIPSDRRRGCTSQPQDRVLLTCQANSHQGKILYT